MPGRRRPTYRPPASILVGGIGIGIGVGVGVGVEGVAEQAPAFICRQQFDIAQLAAEDAAAAFGVVDLVAGLDQLLLDRGECVSELAELVLDRTQRAPHLAGALLDR